MRYRTGTRCATARGLAGIVCATARRVVRHRLEKAALMCAAARKLGRKSRFAPAVQLEIAVFAAVPGIY
jgi:hypothetical protein